MKLLTTQLKHYYNYRVDIYHENGLIGLFENYIPDYYYITYFSVLPISWLLINIWTLNNNFRSYENIK